MGILDRLAGNSTQTTNEAKLGIARAQRGDLGIWVRLADGSGDEVYRITLTPYSPYQREAHEPFSFTFAPGHELSFLQYIEGPHTFKEFMRGKERATAGHVTIEVFTNHGAPISKVFDLVQVLKCYLGKGAKAPAFATEVAGFVCVDEPEIAKIKPQDLKAHSEKVKSEIEEKRKKAEEEKKALEAKAKAEAEKKAAAAKAAQAAAAGAKTAGDTAGAAVGLPPCKVAIVYGTSTGNTGNVAEMIKNELADAAPQCVSITSIRPSDLTVPEILILGVPTWHIGEMQDDWAACLPDVAQQNYAGKKVAIFGLGDGKGYPDTYVDAMQELWEKFEKKGAKLFGLWPTESYEFSKSKALKDGKFLGLVIDVENQDHMSEDRVKRWTAQIRKELGI